MEERLHSNSQVRKPSCTLLKDIIDSANAKSTLLMVVCELTLMMLKEAAALQKMRNYTEQTVEALDF